MVWVIIDTALIILSLGGGAGAILLASRLKDKFDESYNHSLMYYQILLFIFGLYGLLGTILVRNLVTELDIPDSTIVSLAEFIPYLGIPVIITAWFLFIKMSFELVGKSVSRLGAFIYFGAVILGLLSYILLVFGVISSNKFDTETILSYSKYGFSGMYALSLIIVYIILFGAGVFLKHRQKRIMVLNFAIISLVFNVVTLTLLILHNLNPILEKAYMVVFFTGQVPSVAYLYYFQNRHFNNQDKIDVPDFHKSIIENYQLSKREWEIIQQICEGYTNGQISENLFISLQTVKDHVSRIYKKTGVKNRVQLVNMIRMLNNS